MDPELSQRLLGSSFLLQALQDRQIQRQTDIQIDIQMNRQIYKWIQSFHRGCQDLDLCYWLCKIDRQMNRQIRYINGSRAFIEVARILIYVTGSAGYINRYTDRQFVRQIVKYAVSQTDSQLVCQVDSQIDCQFVRQIISLLDRLFVCQVDSRPSRQLVCQIDSQFVTYR